MYNITLAIYKMAWQEDTETFKLLRTTLTRVLVAAFAMIVVFGARMILASVLKLIGVPDSDNLFLNPPFG